MGMNGTRLGNRQHRESIWIVPKGTPETVLRGRGPKEELLGSSLQRRNLSGRDPRIHFPGGWSREN